MKGNISPDIIINFSKKNEICMAFGFLAILNCGEVTFSYSGQIHNECTEMCNPHINLHDTQLS